jgi:hypothetical protein
MAMRLLSLDPGGTTGYAIVDYTDSDFRVETSGQIKGGLAGFLEQDAEMLELYRFDVIVCESFTLREGIYGADLSPVYIIGALEALYQDNKKVYQEPKLKPLCDDSRLKKMGLYKSGKPHENDAIRHAVIYLRNNKHMPTLLAGWKE